MSVADEVLCDHPLFGDYRGETHQTHSLEPVFPGATYEITASGRLELLECTYEDRSDHNAEGLARLAGSMTPVFTDERSDLGYHGCLAFKVLAAPSSQMGHWLALSQRIRCPGDVSADERN
jgi:hypothetical protein